MTKGNTQANIAEMVSEARVKQLIAEEEALETRDFEVKTLKMETLHLIGLMEAARDKDDEVKRREIRNEIVVKNLRLVTQVLKKYGYFSPDKFQNGCIGLLKAADTYDSRKVGSLGTAVPFHNYAAFCVETEIRAAFKRVNRAFESKARGFLDYMDAPVPGADGTEMDKHDTIEDPFAEQEFDDLINEAEVDTLFYDIIIPVIEEYGTRSNDIDMALWRQLEIQYFIEMSLEKSQRQRITLSEMAKQLGTTTQNLRTRHKKVMQRVMAKCEEYGYAVHRSTSGAARLVQEVTDKEGNVKTIKVHNKKSKKDKK